MVVCLGVPAGSQLIHTTRTPGSTVTSAGAKANPLITTKTVSGPGGWPARSQVRVVPAGPAERSEKQLTTAAPTTAPTASDRRRERITAGSPP